MMEVNIYSLHKTTFATMNRAKNIVQKSQNHILPLTFEPCCLLVTPLSVVL